MRFLVNRASQGAASKTPPCRGAVRGPEAAGWPGEYSWYVELDSLEELVTFLGENGGGLALYIPEEGDDAPGLEILDDTDDED